MILSFALFVCVVHAVLLYLLSKDLGVLAVVGDNDELLGSLSNDLLLQMSSTASFDGVQLRVYLVCTVNGDIYVWVSIEERRDNFAKGLENDAKERTKKHMINQTNPVTTRDTPIFLYFLKNNRYKP